MTTTYFDSRLAFRFFPAFAQLQSTLIEPLLIVFAAVFWFVVLPFVGVSVACVQIWDTSVRVGFGKCRSNQFAHSSSLALRQTDRYAIAPKRGASAPPKNCDSARCSRRTACFILSTANTPLGTDGSTTRYRVSTAAAVFMREMVSEPPMPVLVKNIRALLR